MKGTSVRAGESVWLRVRKSETREREAYSVSFIRLHAMYRERGDVLTRDNHEIMRAISTTLRFILAFLRRRMEL